MKVNNSTRDDTTYAAKENSVWKPNMQHSSFTDIEEDANLL